MRNTFGKSFLAGLILAIGARCYMVIDNKMIGAFMFSLGLLTIIDFNLLLYTGAIKEFEKLKQLPYYITILLGNFLGAQLFCVIRADTTALIAHKLSLSLGQVLMFSFFCGVLMAIATMTKNKLITIMCVMAFILCGFEHSIANMCFFSGVFNLDTVKFFVVNIIGNSLGAFYWYGMCKVVNHKGAKY